MTFISNCLAGEAFMDEIDDYIAQWHSGLAGKDQELHEFLGMSWEEYSLWARRPSILAAILNSKIRHISLDEELDFGRVALAARAKNNQEARKMEEWHAMLNFNLYLIDLFGFGFIEMSAMANRPN